MYIPAEFLETDTERINALIDAFPFGLLCHAGKQGVEATHLPFIFRKAQHELISHLAIQNVQATIPDGERVKAIFSGPHGYVSPMLYNAKYSVPTWNYLAVHVTGKIQFLSERAEIIAVMDEMISTFEPTFIDRWHASPDTFINGMFTQLRAFKISIEKVEAVTKLSQNKSVEERSKIADYLLQSTDAAARETGEWMNRYDADLTQKKNN